MERINRLTSSRDFDRVFKQGKRASSGSVLCVAAPGRPDQPPRFGFTVARAIGGAVARNRVKRRLREAVRALLGSVRAGTDVVVVAKPGISGKTFQEVQQDLRVALERTGVAC